MPDFINNLNMAPPMHDLLLNDPENFTEQLAMFTHTDFFDFDTGETANLQVPNFERSTENELKPLDFEIPGA